MDENNNLIQALVDVIAPLNQRIESLEKISKAQEEPEFPFDVWNRVVRKSYGEDYKIN